MCSGSWDAGRSGRWPPARRALTVVHPNGVEPAPKRRSGVEIITYDAEAGPDHFKRLNDAIDASRLKVAISAAFPLEEAAKAHQRLASGHVIGKIVLHVRPAARTR